MMHLAPADARMLNRVRHIDKSAGPYPWPETALTRALQAGELQLATTGNETVGFLVSQAVLDETTLLHLAVAGEHQRQGWGRQILQEWVERQRNEGQQRLLLEVRSTNKAAVSLYRSLGFETVGERRGYYVSPDGVDDALVMALGLNAHGSANG